MRLTRMLPGMVAAAALALPGAAVSGQTVQTFEDVACEGNIGTYGPVNYNNVWYCSSAFPDEYIPHSETNSVVVYTAANSHFNFTDGPVVFNGAWFSGNVFAPVSFQLYLGGAPVWMSEVLAPTDFNPVFLASGYSGLVDEVYVLSPLPGWWIMDDVTFNGTTVPEPGSVVLLGTGLVGLYGVIRRRRSDRKV